MYRRLEFYFETSPLKTRLYFSVWCTNLSRVRQEMSSKNGFINDNDNRCISGVFGWDFNLMFSKVFITCVRQLHTIFVFI